MVVVVVLGIPTFQFLVVWKWAHPFQRLHIPTEDGEWVPNPAAKRLMGALFSTYKPWAYMGALANTVSKLLLTAVVGLAFNKSQGNGMLLSAFFCFGWSFGLVIYRPFVYHRVRTKYPCFPSPTHTYKHHRHIPKPPRHTLCLNGISHAVSNPVLNYPHSFAHSLRLLHPPPRIALQ